MKKTLRADIGFFEKDFMFRAGSEGAREFLSSFKTEALPENPKETIITLLELYALRGYGEFKLESLDKETKTAEISSPNAVEAWGFQQNKDIQREPVCAYASGVLAWICRLAFAREAPYDSDIAVHETECIAQGSMRCVFVVAPEEDLRRRFPGYERPRESITEHELKLNEEILAKNLELQGLNLALERQIRKRTEELWRAEENYKSLMRLSPDTIAVLHTDGRISSINPAGSRFLGIDPEPADENLFLTSMLVDQGVTWDRILWILEKEGSINGLEVQMKRADGNIAIMQLVARFADLLPGRCVEAVFRDVTKSKLMERQVEEARTESEFLNDLLSHDIMNYTFSALHFLKGPWGASGLTEEDRRSLGIVTKDIQGAFELCSSVRDLSRIKALESNDLANKDLDLILAEAFEESQRMFTDKRVTINFNKGSQRFARCSTLATRLFTNLLTNAIKYDSHPEVVVDVVVDDLMQAGVDYWRVRVSDNGKGIPNDQKDQVFRRFHRIDTSVPGTGLGLFVAKFIAEASSGKIWIEDRIMGDHTRGTSMVVLLPKAPGK